jgi:hypothetical protein
VPDFLPQNGVFYSQLGDGACLKACLERLKSFISKSFYKMPVSPRDFALWASATGNKYPETAQEKAAAAPGAYDFIKNIGKAGANAPGQRVGGNIVYDQPISARYADDNSAFHSPITPDNNIPKVSGTYDPTLTGEHFENTSEDVIADNQRQNNILRNVGRAALGAGLVAGGVAIARTPEGQQAIQTATTTAKETAQNIGSRVSSFLGGFGVPRGVNPDVIRNSGDVTPPTTGQRYNQQAVPEQSIAVQVAKGAPTGSVAEATLPTTTESTGVKPVTESDIITSSQTFGPSQRQDILGEHRRQEATQGLLDVASQMKSGASPEDIRTDRELARLNYMASRRGEDPFSTGSQPSSMTSASAEQLTLPSTSQQTSELRPSVGARTEQFLAGLTPAADPWTGEYTELATPKGVGESFLSQRAPAVKGAVRDPWETRQRLTRQVVSPAEHAAYDLIAAGAEVGESIPMNEAVEAVQGGIVSPRAQRAYQTTERVALPGESFEPGERQSGRRMSLRTGASAGERAADLIERYTEQNVSGLTPQGRQSAGAQRLRGVEEQPETYNVLTGGTGRGLRNISVLDPEALSEGREEYAQWTNQVAGATDPETTAKTVASATNPKRMSQMNALLGPESSSIMLHLKTEGGMKPMATNELKRFVGPIAQDVFDRAANYHAGQQGIELPSKTVMTAKGQEVYNPDYMPAANAVLYGNEDTMAAAIPQMAKAFDQSLRERGLKLAVSNEPQAAAGALHTLMGVARGTTTGQLALENFSKMAGRARSQGVVRSEASAVPVNIPLRGGL